MRCRRVERLVKVATLLLAPAMAGCAGECPGPPTLLMRAARRAYDGAPPVIPHKPLGNSCIVCHTATGSEAPGVGLAPANPHLGSARDRALGNCLQCHVFAAAKDNFAESDFRGLPQQAHERSREYVHAPPRIPHHVSMRENCAACHSGVAGREEIRCSHLQRTNCRQCHLPRCVTAAASWPSE
jgi:cytochrome c-type protein NapB